MFCLITLAKLATVFTPMTSVNRFMAFTDSVCLSLSLPVKFGFLSDLGYFVFSVIVSVRIKIKLYV